MRPVAGGPGPSNFNINDSQKNAQSPKSSLFSMPLSHRFKSSPFLFPIINFIFSTLSSQKHTVQRKPYSNSENLSTKTSFRANEFSFKNVKSVSSYAVNLTFVILSIFVPQFILRTLTETPKIIARREATNEMELSNFRGPNELPRKAIPLTAMPLTAIPLTFAEPELR